MNRRQIFFSGGKTYIQKIKGLFGSSLIAYWPLNEASGSVALDVSGNARNGAYTGVDLSITPGPTKTKTRAPYFDGINDFCNVYSASISAAFSGAVGALIAWSKVYSIIEWTDSTTRFAVNLQADANNRVLLAKSGTNNSVAYNYIAGSTSKALTLGSISTTGWLQMAITWSKAADQVLFFYNGAQTGSTLNGLGTWAGTLDSTMAVIGASTTAPAGYFKGYHAHVILLNRVATPAEIANSYNWGI